MSRILDELFLGGPSPYRLEIQEQAGFVRASLFHQDIPDALAFVSGTSMTDALEGLESILFAEGVGACLKSMKKEPSGE